MPLNPPSDTVGVRGLRGVLIRRISSHDKSHDPIVIYVPLTTREKLINMAFHES